MTSIPPTSSLGANILPQLNKVASDGDSAAVEARETSSVKQTEKFNGGFTPKGSGTDTTPTPAARPGGLSTIA